MGCPIIGRIPRHPPAGGASRWRRSSTRTAQVAEAFRMLRGNLDFLALDSDVHSLAVTSSQQGEGKSVTACNLAVAAALAGRRVILIEGDLRRPARAESTLACATSAGSRRSSPARTNRWRRCSRSTYPDRRGCAPSCRASAPTALPACMSLTHGSSVPNPGEIVASQTFARLIDAYKRKGRSRHRRHAGPAWPWATPRPSPARSRRARLRGRPARVRRPTLQSGRRAARATADAAARGRRGAAAGALDVVSRTATAPATATTPRLGQRQRQWQRQHQQQPSTPSLATGVALLGQAGGRWAGAQPPCLAGALARHHQAHAALRDTGKDDPQPLRARRAVTRAA